MVTFRYLLSVLTVCSEVTWYTDT